MMLIFGHPGLTAWAQDKLGVRDFGPAMSFGVFRGTELTAVAVYNRYDPPDIQITFVSTTPRWATKGVIRGILSYPFIQLNCSRITAITAAQNQPARAFLRRFGFREEGIHEEALFSGDAVSHGLLRHECRWLEEVNGKVSALAACNA